MFPGFRRASKCATQPGASEVSELTARPSHIVVVPERMSVRDAAKHALALHQRLLKRAPRPGSATTELLERSAFLRTALRAVGTCTEQHPLVDEPESTLGFMHNN